jgi:hypothetical protein
MAKKRSARRVQTKKIFHYPDDSGQKRTVVALPKGNQLTVLTKPNLPQELVRVEVKGDRFTLIAKEDLVLTVCGINGKNALCKQVFYVRPDQIRANKTVFVPRVITHDKHRAKALRRAGLLPTHFPNGLGNIILTTGEVFVPDGGKSGWITSEQELKQYMNAMKTPRASKQFASAV